MELTIQNLPLWQRQFLDAGRQTTPRPMLDVAAHLLFYLSEPETLHQLALEHLLQHFGADRTDLGFSTAQEDTYAPQHDCRVSTDIPTVRKVAFPNHDPGVQVVWQSPQGVVLDVNCDPIVKNIRPYMLEVLGMHAKLAHRLEYGGQVFGMVCVDQVAGPRHWQEAERLYLHEFLRLVLSPLLVAGQSLQDCDLTVVELTPVERQLLELLGLGLTTKEMAQRLNKSPNTVENQLATLRHKFKVRNKIELLRAWTRKTASSTII